MRKQCRDTGLAAMARIEPDIVREHDIDTGFQWSERVLPGAARRRRD